MAPATNVSYVTQWQVWHKPFVHEMLDEIEQRAPAHVRWPVAIVNAAIDSGHELGFSEYTLYATWLLARHAGEVKLVSSREFPWLRNPPSGVIDKNGDCCPSDESLCQVCIPVLPPHAPAHAHELVLALQVGLGGFHFVSWECLHASAVFRPGFAAVSRQRRQLDISPGPSPPPGRRRQLDISPGPSPPPGRRRQLDISPGPSPPPGRRHRRLTPIAL